MLLLFFFLDFPFVFYILILNILLKRYNKKKKAKKKKWIPLKIIIYVKILNITKINISTEVIENVE